jgi:hypothetical protein
MDDADSGQTPEQVKLPYIPRARRLVSLIGVALILSIGGFVAGYFVRAPTSLLADAGASRIPVYVSVEERIVDDGFQLQGSVSEGVSQDIVPTEIGGAAAAVVTSAPIAVGQTIATGTLVGAVSDRPIFILLARIPLYRDLHVGDEGVDVMEFQAALGLEVSGRVDRKTVSRLRSLYDSVGAVPPGGSAPYVDRREVVMIRSETPTVVASRVALLGDFVTVENPLVTLTTGPPLVTFTASVVDVKEITVGMAVEVRVPGGGIVPGVIANVGPFAPAGDTGQDRDGHRVTVAIPDPSTRGLIVPGAPVVVSAGSESTPAPAVPILAVREDTKGTFVMVEGPTSDWRLDVAVVAQANGWAQIRADDIQSGMRVRVSS